MRNLILASSSSIYGSGYLEYLKPTLLELFANTNEILFIPFAQPSGMSHEAYTDYVRPFFTSIDKKIVGLHEFADYTTAISNAKAIYVGGGNTFLLVTTLYQFDLWSTLKKTIDKGVPFLGTSAGTNICGLNMQTTNDMPIVLPPSFTTLGIVPFNFNAHYVEPAANSTHKGETRATRIKEFQSINSISVLGLKEGSWLKVTDSIELQGIHTAKWFDANGEIKILENGTLPSFHTL